MDVLIILGSLMLLLTVFAILLGRYQGRRDLKKNWPELARLNSDEELSPKLKKILRMQHLKREINWQAGRIAFSDYLTEEQKDQIRGVIEVEEKVLRRWYDELAAGDYS